MGFKDEFPGLKQESFPNLLAGTYERKSPRDSQYNCVAWTLGKTVGHWWPIDGYTWPEDVRCDDSLEAFEELYRSMGYEPCEGGSLEEGWEKIAVFATTEPQHAALQLASGRWTSKLGGRDDDIEHDLEAVSGPLYGKPRMFMKRRR